MGKGSNKPITLIITLTIFTIGWAMRVDALEPRLLWEKTTPFEIGSIKMAAISGDVIVCSRDARQIILYDKQSNKRFHWGPRIDRQPMGIDISADGNTIVYETIWTEHYWQSKKLDIIKLGWDSRVHYCTKTGRELWNKKIKGSAFLSPDGSLVAVVGGHGMGGGPLTVLDLGGNTLWKYDTGLVGDLRFSPEGNYILFYDNVKLYLFDKSGNLLWKKTGTLDPRSVSEGAAYITTEDKKVYDKQGNVILEGKAIVSGDGKRLLVTYPDKIRILSLPDKTLIREYPFKRAGFFSSDGRFIATSGLTNPNNTLIVDTLSQASSEITVVGKKSTIDGTSDGKYLVVVVEDKKLLFYQLY